MSAASFKPREHPREWGLFLIVALGVLLKLIVLHKPLLGNFSSYQTVLAMISRNFMAHNFSNFLLPESNLLINGKHALHMIYYPLPSLLVAFAVKFLGGGIDLWGRLQAVIFTAASTWVFYYWVKRIYDSRVALLSGLVLTLSPMNLIYGQSFQNEAAALFFLTLSFFLLGPPKSSWTRDILSAALFSAAVTLRIHFVVCLPVLVFLILARDEKRKWASSLRYCFFSFLLPLSWFVFTYYVTVHSDRVANHLFMQVSAGKTFPDSLLLDVEFYKRVLETLMNLIVTPLGVVFLLLGLCLRVPRKEEWVFHLAFIAGLSLIVLFPRKVYDHNFYLYPILVPASVLTARGFDWFLKGMNLRKNGIRSRLWLSLFLGLFVVLVFRFYFNPAFRIPAGDLQVLRTGRYLVENLPSDAKLIAAHGSTLDLLYYAQRDGWGFVPFDQTPQASPYWKANRFEPISHEKKAKREKAILDRKSWLEYLRGQGAEYFAVSLRSDLAEDKELLKHLTENYRLISLPEASFAVYDLKKRK